MSETRQDLNFCRWLVIVCSLVACVKNAKVHLDSFENELQSYVAVVNADTGR